MGKGAFFMKTAGNKKRLIRDWGNLIRTTVAIIKKERKRQVKKQKKFKSFKACCKSPGQSWEVPGNHSPRCAGGMKQRERLRKKWEKKKEGIFETSSILRGVRLRDDRSWP